MSVATLREPSGGRVVRDPFGMALTTPQEIEEFEAWLDAAQEARQTPAAMDEFDRYMNDLELDYERNGSWFDEDPPANRGV